MSDVTELKPCPFCEQKTKYHGGFDYHHSEFLKCGKEVVRVFTREGFPKGMNATLTDDVSDRKYNCGNIKALTAERDALRKQTTWQPIETAPKDKAIIVGAFLDRGAFRPFALNIVKWGRYRIFIKTWVIPYAADALFYKPTHWMHLPTPPSQKGDE